MSGNSLLSYYSGKLFGLMGIDEPGVKSRINIANQCWSFINATILALVITRFRRRWMYMISATSMRMSFPDLLYPSVPSADKLQSSSSLP